MTLLQLGKIDHQGIYQQNKNVNTNPKINITTKYKKYTCLQPK